MADKGDNMTDKSKIMISVQERKIEHFIHFTNVLNLPSILSNGLLSKDILDYNWIEYNYNDDLRLDELSDSISLSISSPNYKMFYQLRCNNPSRNWVVLVLDAQQILDLNCAFCFTNAANSFVSRIPLKDRMTFDAFNSMFAERDNQVSRAQLKLSSFEPTDPQAEILVFDSIPTSAIQFALFNEYEIMNQYAPLLNINKIPYTRDLGYYYPRHDYSFW